MKKKLIPVGSVFSRLTVIAVSDCVYENVPARASRKARVQARQRYLCRCECGTELKVIGSSLLSENTRSCGCLNRARVSQTMRKHGHASGYKPSRTYVTWQGMRERCNNPKAPKFHRYGARGILVCARWNDSFENFLADMGERPEGMTLDRFPDNKGNYEPGNCRWATCSEQQSNLSTNRMFDWNGERLTFSQLSRLAGISHSTLHKRLAKGWALERALQPSRNVNAVD